MSHQNQTSKDIKDVSDDDKIRLLHLQSVMSTHELIEKKRLYTSQHIDIMCDLRNFQQEVSLVMHDLTSTFPSLISSAEKIKFLLEEMIHAFNEYLRSVNKVTTSNKDVFSDEKTSAEEEFHYDNEGNNIMKTELSLQELIVQKVGILRVRLQTLQTTRQKLAEQVSSTQ